MSAPIPPDQLPPGAFDSQTTALYASCIPVTVFATVGVGLRFYAKRLARSYLWWDDAFIVAALILYYALAATHLASTASWGLGRHIYILNPVTQITPFLKSLLAYQILYFACQSCIKISLIYLYFRLFSPYRAFRVACYCTMALVVSWFLAMFFATIFNCVPVALFWDKTLDGHCVDLLKFAYGNGITNLLLDVIVLCLPFPMLYKLQLNRRAKLSLCLVFLLGFFICAVSIIRISSIHTFGDNENDPTWGAVGIYIWSQVEPACGIIGASLPTMRPLFSKFYSLSSNALSRQYGASGGSAQNGTGGGQTSRSGLRSNMGIKGQSTARSGGFSRMEEDEQPIKMADLGIKVQRDIEVSTEPLGSNLEAGRQTKVHALSRGRSQELRRGTSQGYGFGEADSRGSSDDGAYVQTRIK